MGTLLELANASKRTDQSRLNILPGEIVTPRGEEVRGSIGGGAGIHVS